MNKPLVFVVLLMAGTGCGGGTSADWPPSPEGYRIQVTVDNDLTSRSDILVRMVAGSAVPVTLGGASPGEEKAFEYTDRSLGGSYTLTATTGDGRSIRSRAFTLFPGAIVIWRIQLNELRVVRGSMPMPDTVRLGSAPGR